MGRVIGMTILGMMAALMLLSTVETIMQRPGAITCTPLRLPCNFDFEPGEPSR